MLRDVLYELLSLVAPPRASEKLVRTLSLRELRALRDENHTLPYYDPRVTALVWECKFYANPKARALCGALLAEALAAQREEELSTPLLIPTPTHALRVKERGHNHTTLLCEAALPHLDSSFEYAPTALVRARHTAPQHGLPRHVRLKNMADSMRAKERVRGRTCVVVDDVTTTGATFAEAKRALGEAGARSVVCVALARA